MMKFAFILLFCICILFHASLPFANQKIMGIQSKANYSVGFKLANDLGKLGVAVRPDAILKGVEDGISGKPALLTPEEMTNSLAELQKIYVKNTTKLAQEKAQKNLDEGKKFLTTNSKKNGVISLPSGLQYEVFEKGYGSRKPTLMDKVTVHYRGKLLNGNEFDSSYSRGKASLFNVDSVITGWAEALQMMNEGSKWRIFLPPELAYGRRGAGEQIEPNSTLVFDIELISVLHPAE